MKVFKLISLALAIVVIASILTACDEKKFDQQMASQLQAVLEDAVESPETPFLGALLYVSSPELGTWSGVTGLGNIETEPKKANPINELWRNSLLGSCEVMCLSIPISRTAPYAD